MALPGQVAIEIGIVPTCGSIQAEHELGTDHTTSVMVAPR